MKSLYLFDHQVPGCLSTGGDFRKINYIKNDQNPQERVNQGSCERANKELCSNALDNQEYEVLEDDKDNIEVNWDCEYDEETITAISCQATLH